MTPSAPPIAPRRRFLQAGTALGAAWLLPRPAAAYPDLAQTPVRIIVPDQPGTTLDVIMRVAARLAEGSHGDVTLQIENRPGAAQLHGAATLSRLDRDEQGIIAQCVPAWLREPLLREADYDPATDFTYIVPLAAYPTAIAVRQDSPYRGLPDLLEDGLRHPETISYGTAGIGGAGHLLMEDLGRRHGVRWNPIAVRSARESARGVRHGYLDLMVDGTEWPAQVAAGKMRVLATFTPARLEGYPDVPTAAEQGLGRAHVSPLGLAGPRHLDRERVRLLHAAFSRGMQQPAYREHLRNAGLAPLDLDSGAFARLMQDTYAQARDMARPLGLRAMA